MFGQSFTFWKLLRLWIHLVVCIGCCSFLNPRLIGFFICLCAKERRFLEFLLCSSLCCLLFYLKCTVLVNHDALLKESEYPKWNFLISLMKKKSQCSLTSCFCTLKHTNICYKCLYTLKNKVFYGATEEPFLSKWFHKEPLTSEEPFCFTKASLWWKKVLQIIKK